MKKTILSLVVMLGLSLTSMSAFAQKKQIYKGGFPLSKDLNLTADQESRLRELRKDFGTKLAEIKSDTLLTKEDAGAKMKALGEKYKADSKSVLTPEQVAKVKDLINDKPLVQRMKNHKQGDRKYHSAHRPNRDIYQGLNLTDEQKQKIKSLTDEFRTKNKELRDQHRAAINEVLTPEQQSKLKEKQDTVYKKDRKDRSKNGIKKDRKAKDKA